MGQYRQLKVTSCISGRNKRSSSIENNQSYITIVEPVDTDELLTDTNSFFKHYLYSRLLFQHGNSHFAVTLAILDLAVLT